MKTLYLIRHGKSSWDDQSLKDFERPLLAIGEERSNMVADFLRAKKVFPDLIVSSHAVRAFETASLLAVALEYPRHNIQVESQIYHGGTDSLWSLVFSLPDHKNKVFLVGHNPTMTQFANGFLEKKIDYLPTSGVVCVSFFTDHWNELLMAERKVEFVVFPRHLKD
jgi:phosphohistidine phosphatase